MKYLIFALIILAACSKRLTNTDSTSLDSVSVRIVERLDTVYVAGDSVTVVEYLECDSLTNQVKPEISKAAGIRSNIKLVIGTGGKAVVTCTCDSLREVVRVYDRELFRLRHRSMAKTETLIQFKTRKVDIFCRWFTGAVLLVGVGYAVGRWKGLV